MDLRAFEQTSLWKNTLAAQDDEFETQRTRLRSSYENMRRNSVILCGNIQNDIPNLTLHDVNHLDALWSVADLIIGDNYPMNPAEAYIFGISVLLHDSAHTLFAYDNGIDDLKKTPEWRDSVVSILDSNGLSEIFECTINDPPKEYVSDILFSVLRSLHAKRAEELAFFNIPSSGGSTNIFLLEDNELRNSYGALAGLIAASHHWPIDTVTTRFQKRIGAISGLPAIWHIDPVKIACLLRCADAGQIDMRRAPDFLFSLLNLRGVSADHWQAQNKISQPIQDPDDTSALLFSSTGPYSQDEADAWWVAWDLIQVVDGELQKSNALLRNTNRPAFEISRVKDADSVERFTTHVTTIGWKPILADVTTSNPVKLASFLGGAALYGTEPLVPIRELIQNASDSIRARRILEKNDSQLSLSIGVTLRKCEINNERYWLDIHDNGVGMSEKVLTGALLDFGSSLWNTHGVEQEFPGLLGSFFRPTGKYGIGFFSIFIFADRVEVTSRRYDDGLDKAKTLLFRDGLKQRPIVIEAIPRAVSTQFTTCISFRIASQHDKRFLEKLLEEKSYEDGYRENNIIGLRERIASMFPSLDCDVYVKDLEKDEVKAHSHEWYEMPAIDWLREITMAEALGNETLNVAIEEASERLSIIKRDGNVVGRAAISRYPEDWNDKDFPTPIQPGFITHGGVSARLPDHHPAAPFIGAIEMYPYGANRFLAAVSGDANYREDMVGEKSSLQSWFKQQEDYLDIKNKSLKDLEGPFNHFAQLGHISEDTVLLRHYVKGSQPNCLDDLPIMTLRSLHSLLPSISDQIVFVHTVYNSIQGLQYYDEEEFDTLNEYMTKLEISNVFFPSIFVDDVSNYEHEQDTNNQESLLNTIFNFLEVADVNLNCELVILPETSKTLDHVNGFVKVNVKPK